MTDSIEITVARVEEKLEAIRHDGSNSRLMLNALSGVQDAHYKELKGDIKELSKTLLGIGISLIGSLFTIMIAIVTYFVAQKMETVDYNSKRITTIEKKAS